MSLSPNPLQTLFLWRLLASEGGEFWKNTKPQVSTAERKELEAAGLIAIDKRKESDRKGARPIMYVSLSEQGWNWAVEHLNAEISKKSNASGPILQDILAKLKIHLERTGSSLADFVCPPEGEVTSEPEDIPSRIRRSYCSASGGRWNVRVRLAELRRALPEVPRAELDESLLAMERQGSVVLYPLDDPQEIEPEDEAAGLPNSLGIRRHIVYLER